MTTLNETQMQVLEAAAKAGGASPEGLHNRTVASLVKQGLITEKRGRGNKASLVATAAGVVLVKEGWANTAEMAEAAPPSPAPVVQAPGPKSPRVAKSKQVRASEPVPRSTKPKSRKPEAAPAQPAVREAQGKLGLLIGLLRQPVLSVQPPQVSAYRSSASTSTTHTATCSHSTIAAERPTL